jgi:hypothetical protein
VGGQHFVVPNIQLARLHDACDVKQGMEHGYVTHWAWSMDMSHIGHAIDHAPWRMMLISKMSRGVSSTVPCRDAVPTTLLPRKRSACEPQPRGQRRWICTLLRKTSGEKICKLLTLNPGSETIEEAMVFCRRETHGFKWLTRCIRCFAPKMAVPFSADFPTSHGKKRKGNNPEYKEQKSEFDPSWMTKHLHQLGHALSGNTTKRIWGFIARERLDQGEREHGHKVSQD